MDGSGTHLLLLGSWPRHQILDLAGPAGVVVEVADRASASAAVLAAASKERVVAVVTGSADLADGLYRDLRRLGGVSLRRSVVEVARIGLGAQSWEVLSMVARGLALNDVAEALHVSRRTVDRRLAQVRHEVGVRTTIEAVLAHRAGRVCPAAPAQRGAR
jgi:DNA-binding NarL/FixJ family response regulator